HVAGQEARPAYKRQILAIRREAGSRDEGPGQFYFGLVPFAAFYRNEEYAGAKVLLRAAISNRQIFSIRGPTYAASEGLFVGVRQFALWAAERGQNVISARLRRPTVGMPEEGNK